MKKLVSVVIPAYNEEENIVTIIVRLTDLFKNIDFDLEILIIDDGSKDNTLNIIKTIAENNPEVFYIEFSRNFGKDNSLRAGLNFSKGEAIITIDADMQHPPEIILEMLALWKEGNDVIYAVRNEKNIHAGTLNNIGSAFFYNIVNRLTEIELENGIADFRLLDKKVVKVLGEINEMDPFYRGLVKWVGFKQKAIPYTPADRLTGETKYSTKALTKLALKGITSFSTKPLNTAIYLGFLFSSLSILYIPYVLYSFYSGKEVSGWASTIMTIVFFGGLQLIILGIIGIYIGKIFIQSKNRPNYIIRSTNLK